jgi:hypothetical protein
MADIELKAYSVDTDGGLLQRENVFILAAVAMYGVTTRLKVYAGPGYEIETHESFFVTRIGAKYELKMKNHLDFTPTIEMDFKETEYSSVFFGASLGKRF